MIKAFLIWIGLSPSKSDLALQQLVNSSYESVEVIGRGTVRIDPKEVMATESFKSARQQAKSIVEQHNKFR